MPRWGAHFSARAQERLLNVARQRICEWIGEFVCPDDSGGVGQVAPVVPGLVNNSDHAEHPNAFQRNLGDSQCVPRQVLFWTASIWRRFSSGGVGKTRVWNKGGVQPDHVDTLGEDAWAPWDRGVGHPTWE